MRQGGEGERARGRAAPVREVKEVEEEEEEEDGRRGGRASGGGEGRARGGGGGGRVQTQSVQIGNVAPTSSPAEVLNRA